MVVFTCNACGESLKKNKVEKHISRCYNFQSVSCIDCSQDFDGTSYTQHIKCISEDVKYGGANYVPKENKGEVKQNQWIQQVQSVISSVKADTKVSDLLEKLTEYPNIPRKRKKFVNFLKNSLCIKNDALVTNVWDLLSKEIFNEKSDADVNKSTSPEEEATQEVVNGVKEAVEETVALPGEKKEKKKKKKEKQDQNQAESVAVEQEIVNGMNQPIEESVGDKKEKKKKEKEKRDQNELESVTIEQCDVAGGLDGSVTVDDGDKVEGKGKKKKKKKDKKEKEVAAAEPEMKTSNIQVEMSEVSKVEKEDPLVDAAMEDQRIKEGGVVEKKKKKKRDKKEKLFNEMEDTGPAVVINGANLVGKLNGQDTEVGTGNVHYNTAEGNEEEQKEKEKKEKKKKKKRKEAECEDAPNGVTPAKQVKLDDTVSPPTVREAEVGVEVTSQLANDGAGKEKFSWTDVILEVVGRAEGHETSMKKLRKKVLSRHHAICGGPQPEGGDYAGEQEQMVVKLEKRVAKLVKQQRLTCSGDNKRVKLVE